MAVMAASNTVADRLIQDIWMASHFNPLSQYLRLAAYIMYYLKKHMYSMYMYILKVLVATLSFLLLASVLCIYFHVYWVIHLHCIGLLSSHHNSDMNL